MSLQPAARLAVAEQLPLADRARLPTALHGKPADQAGPAPPARFRPYPIG